MATDPMRELLDRFAAGHETMQRIQQAFAQLVLPAEQRRALADGLVQMLAPGEQINALIEMTKALSPPLAQIESLAGEIAGHREQLGKMSDELARIDTSVQRLLTAAEQLAQNQNAFLQLADTFTRTQHPPKGD